MGGLLVRELPQKLLLCKVPLRAQLIVRINPAEQSKNEQGSPGLELQIVLQRVPSITVTVLSAVTMIDWRGPASEALCHPPLCFPSCFAPSVNQQVPRQSWGMSPGVGEKHRRW